MDISLPLIVARQEGLITLEINGEIRHVGRWSFQERREARSMSEISVCICIWPKQKEMSQQMLIFLQRFGKALRLKKFSAHLVRMLDQEAECSFWICTIGVGSIREHFFSKLRANNFLDSIKSAVEQKGS